MKNNYIKKGLVVGIIVLFIGSNFVSGLNIHLKNTTIPLINASGYIQDLIDNASDGDTIYIPSGIYYENIIINKSISLVGEDKYTTIIDGGGGENTLYLQSDWINLSEFTIRNGNMMGIKITSNYNSIINNNIISNPVYSIVLLYSNNNTIEGNNISDNQIELTLYNSHNNIINGNIISEIWGMGITLDHSNNNTVIDNYISKCLGGIGLAYYSSDNAIINNSITNNDGYGIKLFQDANYNTIKENNIGSNNYTGLDLESSSNNIIYHNNFMDNSPNAYDRCNNIWDDGYPSGGNYWNDYNGLDVDGDGIGDTPYPISGGSNQDDYPFMETNGWNNPPPNKPTINGPDSGKPGIEYDYIFNYIDPYGHGVRYFIDWGDKTYNITGVIPSGENVTVSHAWATKGEYIITAKTVNTEGLISGVATKVVTIPKNRAINTPFIQFLQYFLSSHPNLFPILKKLLKD